MAVMPVNRSSPVGNFSRRSALGHGLLPDVRQLLWIAYGIETGDEPALHAYRQDAADLAVDPEDQGRVAVDVCGMHRADSGDPAQQGGDRRGPYDGYHRGLNDSPAVGQQDDIRGE